MTIMKKIIKIFGIIGVVLVAAILSALLIGGRDMAAPDVSDLIPETQAVPADQNAYPHLITAAEAISLPTDVEFLIDYIEGKQIYSSLIADLLQKNEAAFPLIDKAMGFSRCEVPKLEEPDYIGKWYQIALLLGAHSVYHLHAGHTGRSTASAISLLHFGDLILYDIQNLFDVSPGIKILQLGLNQVGSIVSSEATSREDLQQLAGALAALRPLDHSFKRAFQFKFQSVINQVDGFRASKKSIVQTFPDTMLMPFFLRKTTWFPGYMFKENATKQRLAELYRDTIQNMSLNYADMKLYDIAEFFGLGKQSPWWFYSRPNLVGRVFYAFTTPEIETYVEGRCQMEGTIRASQLIVAMKTFEKDNGTLPDQLAQLCPTYLPSVPLDTFDGKPFRYAPEKGIVYSVSKDLKDSGGSTEIPPDEIYGPEYPRTWIAEDAVFKINP